MGGDLGHILVVDDDENNRDLLARRLRRSGYAVALAGDGEAALGLVESSAFDVVLLDVMMPGIDGFEVLSRIRATRAATDLPVIMATAKDQSEDVVHALGLGANDYVTKPLDYPVVAARIRTQVSLKRAVEQVRQLERRLAERNRDLEGANSRMTRDLRAAARIQEALLPRSSPDVHGLKFAWSFRPCEELAGDGLSAIKLDRDRAALYVLDVSGHGVASSLMSVSLGRLLSPPTDASSILVRGGGGADHSEPVGPSEVANRLNKLFPFEVETEQYSTLIYAILDAAALTFRYTLAGHPAPIHLPVGGPARFLPGRGFPVGLADASYSFPEWSERLAYGDRIYLYSDGIPEAVDPEGEPFGNDRFLAILEAAGHDPLCSGVNEVVSAIEAWSGVTGVRDDVSILAVEVRGAD